ncbi:NADH dehydrogenase [ubiquinone] 1 alpha subcomplex assembly factor 3 [Rhinatrema bivittatum]|uniref:NADH dehydrogenase [ubiquinone] 1 alpha subcomplex assembly factor 3 n=1 Tax=Rhinatrema bivittatum TaxID=194408 RepID=UPI001127198A|nr:NADH dehydrogenase [ubiquinone] 1 alpha subcomplex assembly factor 3 [Rhinatrema bivittatum]XP_029457123.1 NADH dehydrogenase [ubiquinone] 1 alpha subcomplex assembly factor 3 [Rhinatrema bivittatum]XP_029457124.1 NADH dehydrogenase [ubiquinone] 1 alpha subcomplex assembly factor 3 [Rhinatrema bivittatum]XP_029457125.1 NADH dehydrogenase [ubiquinone] 1 alpha subcomplex assembly factor 3 [Rhinatrema bivittatum]
MAVASLRMLWRSPIHCWKLGGIAMKDQNWQQQRSHRLSPSDDELYQKTTVSLLEKDSSNLIFIDGYTTHGFTINGNRIIGPCAVIPRTILQWNVGSYKDISRESLALFYMLEPKIEILVLGTGGRVERLDSDLLKFMRQKGIAVEVQDTPNACATFNFLSSEHRITAAGLIPPLGFKKTSLIVSQ